MEDTAQLKAEARSMKLTYTTDKMPGYSREARGKEFTYYDKDGAEITDEDELKRIKSLVIPPAWAHVWISPKSNGHLQATGVDAAGRKQYKYHPRWSKTRNERKHGRMLDFGKSLPLLRKKLEHDILREDFTKEKVIAMAITVMDKTAIRIGNASYAKMYGSFGLTSLRNKHIKITGNKMTIAFRGKKGVFQEILLTHARLARMMNKLKDIPGQELFQYYESDGSRKTIDSDAVNEYIATACGEDFTAKDFRTWSGTVEAFTHLTDLATENAQTHPDKDIVAALDLVAEKLGNTRAVCKKYYVHPTLLSAYKEGKLDKYIQDLSRLKNGKGSGIHEAEERLIMKFLEEECRC